MARTRKKNNWIKFPEDKEIQFKVKPFSILHLKIMPTEKNITPETMWTVFNAVVLDWKGINDYDGTTMVCNEKNKRIIAEENMDLLTFVFTESIDQDKKVVGEPETKN